MIGSDELYGNDEKALNEFLVQHPMLNLESTSSETLKLISGLFDQSSTTIPDLPVIPKSYDDQMLRPANRQTGERDCACGARCMTRFLARWRHGSETNLAFTCTEFLLPTERETFLKGNGLPARRKKCLICTRYFTTYLYYKARMDTNFKLESSGIDTNSFVNSIAAPIDPNAPNQPDLLALRESQQDMPQSASSVLTSDGYKPECMLFVDEEFSDRQASRTTQLSVLNWRPVVRFCSKHYVFMMTSDGPRVVQTGVATSESTDTGLLFRLASADRKVAPPELLRQ